MIRRLLSVCLGALLALLIIVVALAQAAPFAGTVTQGANLRGGPGTNFPIVGSLRAGDVVSVTKTNSDATWYQLDSGSWIAAFLVEPSARSVGTLKPAGGATATPTKVVAQPTPIPTSAPAARKATMAELLLYANDVLDPLDTLANAMSEVSVLLENPRPASNSWRINIATQFALIRVAHQQLLDLTPPTSLAGVHARLTEGTQKCSDATELAAQGIDEIDPDLLIAAAELVDECAAIVSDASDLFDEQIQ